MVKNWFHSALFLQVSRCLTVPRSWENDKGKQPLKRGGRGPTCHENYVNKVYIYLFIYIIQYTIIYIYIYIYTCIYHKTSQILQIRQLSHHK